MNPRRRYFDLLDERVPGRWHVSAPDFDVNGRKINPWQFKRGEVIHLDAPPLLHLVRPGRTLEFTLTGLTIPLVNGYASVPITFAPVQRRSPESPLPILAAPRLRPAT